MPAATPLGLADRNEALITLTMLSGRRWARGSVLFLAGQLHPAATASQIGWEFRMKEKNSRDSFDGMLLVQEP